MNTAVCNSTGESFGEVIQHFVYSGDETCMQACENGRINQEVGHGVGRNSLISENNQKFVTDAMARKDSANEGMNMVEGFDLILEVIPQLSWKQSKQYFVKTTRCKHSHLLKNKIMVVQSTTTKRSDITIPQQYCWMSIF